MTSRRPVSYSLIAMGSISGLIACLPVDPANNDAHSDSDAEIIPISEIEPNDESSKATPVVFDNMNRARLTGYIPPLKEAGDVDYYALGPMKAGDQIVVDVNTPQSDLDALAAIFDADGNLFIINDNQDAESGIQDPFVDEIFRHDSENYVLLITRSAFGGQTSGDYEIIVKVTREGTVPTPPGQMLLLNFRGGTLTIRGQRTLTIDPFDAADIDPVYAGQTEVIKRQIFDTVKQNYARFDIKILTTDNLSAPLTGNVSSVYFGGYDPEGLGSTLSGTDPYNHDPNDDAIVFTGRFTPDLFTNRPDAKHLGVAIGNVGSHEAGHLFGLNHVRDSTALMNAYDAPNNLLVDQRFKASSLDLLILPLFDFSLKQDSGLLLAETLGRAAPATDLSVELGGDPVFLSSADFDGDGDVDLIAANAVDSRVNILWNNERESSFLVETVMTGLGTVNVVVSDFDGDGDLDLAVANLASDNISIVSNDGAGHFVISTHVAVMDGPYAAAAGDFDGDGDMDLAVVHCFTGEISVLSNNGNETFALPVVVAHGSFPMSVVTGDLDADGDTDLAVANAGTIDNPGGVLVALNNGDGTFTSGDNLASEAILRYVAIGDLNNDGAADLAVADLFTNSIGVMINDGNANFTAPEYYLVGDLPESVTVADLDADGDLDLIAANADTNDVSVLLNQGDGTFAPEWPYGVSQGPSSLTTGDLDGDGDVDLAVANKDAGTVSILFNNGNGTFGTATGAGQ